MCTPRSRKRNGEKTWFFNESIALRIYVKITSGLEYGILVPVEVDDGLWESTPELDFLV